MPLKIAMQNGTFRTVSAALLALLVSCQNLAQQEPASEGAPQESTHEKTSPVIGGKPSEADQNHTVLIRTPTTNGTGVVVAPNLILTALHLTTVYDKTFSSFVCVPGQQTIDVYNVLPVGDVQVFAGPKFPAPSTKPSASVKKIIPLPTIDICKGDLSFLLMEQDVPNTITAPLRLDAPPVAGEAGYSVGWGMFNVDGSFPKNRQTKEGMQILAIGPGQYKRPEGLVFYDLYEGHMVTSPGTCLGDSGSAFFSQQNAVLGILSSGDSDDPASTPTAEQPFKFCETATVFYTRLDVFKDKIMAAFEEAGHRPWLEGQPKPGNFGEACVTEANCDTGPCVAGVCSRSCKDTACPENFDCIESVDDKVCAPQNAGQGGNGQAGNGASPTGLQGSPCTEASECVSGLCLKLETTQVCSARCEQTPCSSGWECTTQGDQRICLPPAKVVSSDSGCALPSTRPVEGFPLPLVLAVGMAWRVRRRRASR